MTIGQELSHIENAKLDRCKGLFSKTLLSGECHPRDGRKYQTQIRPLRWRKNGLAIFLPEKNISGIFPSEPKQEAARMLEVKADVPLDALYKAFHVGSRTDKSYYAMDLIGELLGGGGSSRLFQTLVKEKKLFSNIECYHFGSSDPGLLLIEGKLIKGTSDENSRSGHPGRTG